MRRIVRRLLEVRLPEGRSAFLWEPRKTGKTTWIREQFARPGDRRIDMLQTDTFAEYASRPALLRALRDEHRVRHSLVVCLEREPRKLGPFEVLPWRTFLERLFGGAYSA